MTTPTLLLVAHGTRYAPGIAELERIASGVRDRLGGPDVRLAYVDVLGPTVSEALRDIAAPAVVVPAFLAAGYHVRHDVPTGVLRSGRQDAIVTPPLGPDPVLGQVMRERLEQAGRRPTDRIVFAAAGSSDERATEDVRLAAVQFGRLSGASGRIGYLSTARPLVTDLVATLRATGTKRRIAVATYLLAPGLFHTALHDSGADVIAEPLGGHPAVIELICDRYASASEKSARMTPDVGAGIKAS